MSRYDLIQHIHDQTLPKDDGMEETGYPGLKLPREGQKNKPDGSFVKDPGHDLSKKFAQLKRVPRPYQSVDDALEEQNQEGQQEPTGGWFNADAQE